MMELKPSMISKSLQLASIFLILANLLAHGGAQSSCLGNRSYASNSTYKANLDALLSSLPANVDSSGFYNASMGQSPDAAHAYVLCRADVQLETCSGCIRTAVTEILKSCPNNTRAVRYEEFCTLRYSEESMFGIRESTAGTWFYWNVENASSPNEFMSDVGKLLDNLRNPAASGGLRKAAAGNISSVDSQTIYSLVQCTPDLSPESCSACLREAAELPSQCDNKRGCRVLKPSCNMRYEVSSFYNQTRLQEIQALVVTTPQSSPPPTPPPPSPPSPPPPPSTPPGTKGNNKTRTIIIVVVSIVVCLIVAALVGILLMKRRKKKPMETLDRSTPEINVAESLQFDFRVIKAATNDFSNANILGQGGFGTVYKGELSNGQEIAVKRLSVDSGQGDMEFKNEVLLVAKLQHRNLVRLVGFSIEGKERLLVYEFFKNTSLDRFIFDPVKRNYLDWETRDKIIGGISRGLLYLHEESRLKIIHRDLKASNILLDDEMNPKIADFGMARLFAADETQGNTNRIVGTYGYMSPEYAMHGQFSARSDVFSFGVLILEIITGQKTGSFRNGDNFEDLLSMAWKHWRQGTIENLIDPVLRPSLGSLRDVLRYIHIGLLCVQDSLTNRPTMATVNLMLSSSTITLPIPLEPLFFTTSGYNSKITIFQAYDSKEFDSTKSLSQNKSDHSSESTKNDMSITEFHPR